MCSRESNCLGNSPRPNHKAGMVRVEENQLTGVPFLSDDNPCFEARIEICVEVPMVHNPIHNNLSGMSAWE